jgi:hypothetical protein
MAEDKALVQAWEASAQAAFDDDREAWGMGLILPVGNEAHVFREP